MLIKNLYFTDANESPGSVYKMLDGVESTGAGADGKIYKIQSGSATLGFNNIKAYAGTIICFLIKVT